MQFQPHADKLRIGRVPQPERRSEDALQGGDTLGRRLGLTAPWRVGTSRLWEPRDPGSDEK